ncbi:protein PAM71, chloroplastic isoform X2 [Lotus japonicus]|uniref:protein PAM71, chloroplastic isoform X2 n=1 Tax=Lotus japonicus TaxID=34305 RepID=UPI0025831DC3|nr:protein PAM71, chloroplastic isoform X2 [Lotus japonicus]
MQAHLHSLLRPHSLPSFPKPLTFSSSSSKKNLPLQSSTFTRPISACIFRNVSKLRMLLSPPRCNQPPRFEIDHKLRGTTQGFTRVCKNSEDAGKANPESSSGDNGSTGLLKFMLFFAFLTLQDSHPAAASDFAAGLNPISIFGDFGDISTGFASAFLLIFFSELGDKTFFIAALLAARNSAGVVFVGTFGALAAMTLISVVLGRTFHYVDELLPFRFGETDLPVDDIAAVCLLVYFGVSTLLDASSSDGQKSDDEQKEAELAVSEFSGNGAGILAAASTAASTFLLVFVAEWGDKSFFSTIGHIILLPVMH